MTVHISSLIWYQWGYPSQYGRSVCACGETSYLVQFHTSVPVIFTVTIGQRLSLGCSRFGWPEWPLVVTLNDQRVSHFRAIYFQIGQSNTKVQYFSISAWVQFDNIYSTVTLRYLHNVYKVWDGMICYYDISILNHLFAVQYGGTLNHFIIQ